MSLSLKLAVIGHPIKHSKSPIIHTEWLKRAGIDGTYEALDIAPDELKERVRDLAMAGWHGFNITLPYKEDILNLCDEVDETAQQIGAVNTVKIIDGKLFGYNTDAYGFTQNIKVNSSFYFYEKTAFVLGAGGAARAVLQGLIDEDIAKIYLSNRTKFKAEALQSMAADKIEIIDWDKRESVLNEIDLLVNTTSLGMLGKEPLEMDITNLNSSARVTDIVYMPLMTDLLKQADKNGYDIILGVGMLLYQAQKSFEIWTGQLPEVDEVITNRVLI